MSIELQKAMSAAWEKDSATAVQRGRVDDAYELGFIAAWRAAKAPAIGQPHFLTDWDFGGHTKAHLLREANEQPDERTVIAQAGIESIIRRHAIGWIMDKEQPMADYLFSKAEEMASAILAVYPPHAIEREAQQPLDCRHEPYQGYCGHCNAPYINGVAVVGQPPERESISPKAVYKNIINFLNTWKLYPPPDSTLALDMISDFYLCISSEPGFVVKVEEQGRRGFRVDESW